MNLTEIAQERSDTLSKQNYRYPVIQRFRESEIQVLILNHHSHTANQTRLFQAVMQENGRK